MNSPKNVTAEFEKVYSISGCVMDGTVTPPEVLPGYVVWLRLSPTDQFFDEATSGTDGQFTFNDVPGGSYCLGTSSPNYKCLYEFDPLVEDQDGKNLIVGLGNIPTNVEDIETGQLPESYSLSQNYPNPFNPTTFIEFELPRSSHVRLTVYNLLGEEVRTLLDEEVSMGRKRVMWDGIDTGGDPVPSGVYLYRIEAGSFSEAKKMMLLK